MFSASVYMAYGPSENSMSCKTSVLVIDDEPSVADALEMILSDCGYEVVVAMTGRGGLEQAMLRRFDVTITDLRLPDISGLEVLNRIRAQDPFCTVIVITAHGTPKEVDELIRCGATSVLAKPFFPSDILESIRLALDGHKRC